MTNPRKPSVILRFCEYEFEELNKLVRSFGFLPRSTLVAIALDQFLHSAKEPDFLKCRKRKVNMIIDRHTLNRLTEHARNYDVRRTDIVRLAIRGFIAKYSPQGSKTVPVSPTLNQLNSSTTAWLLDPSEPGVRAQALMNFQGRAKDDPEVRAARKDSLVRGSMAKVLSGLVVSSDLDGLWNPKYGAPYHRLIALADMGTPGNDERIIRVLDAILENFSKPDGGFGRKDSHLCITGNIVRAAIHFGRGDDPRVRRGVEWLLAHQRADGGWNCFPEDEPGSTLDSWEPLAALGKIPRSQRSSDTRRARERGVEFFLERRLGVEAGYEPWRRIHFPRHYYYDFLLGLELATSLGDPQDPRLKPALDLLLSKSSADGRWQLDVTHPDVDPEGDPPYKPIYAEMMKTAVRLEVEPPGSPSRWATLSALRVIQRKDPPTLLTTFGSTAMGDCPGKGVKC